ncbi:unnamed protein product [Orchesella dallaii]|uniref:Uncharacterized protein n=1 Tax=Orchesella dallaii TaxID=48710 RepID=A0ABP1PJP6_9HEXA
MHDCSWATHRTATAQGTRRWPLSRSAVKASGLGWRHGGVIGGSDRFGLRHHCYTVLYSSPIYRFHSHPVCVR